MCTQSQFESHSKWDDFVTTLHSLGDLRYTVWVLGVVLSNMVSEKSEKLGGIHKAFLFHLSLSLFLVAHLSPEDGTLPFPVLWTKFSWLAPKLILLLHPPAGSCHELQVTAYSSLLCPAQWQAGTTFLWIRSMYCRNTSIYMFCSFQTYACGLKTVQTVLKLSGPFCSNLAVFKAIRPIFSVPNIAIYVWHICLTHPTCFPQLVMTVLMTCVVIYLYTVIAFNYFRKFYIKQNPAGGERVYTCDSMSKVNHHHKPHCSPSLTVYIPSSPSVSYTT